MPLMSKTSVLSLVWVLVASLRNTALAQTVPAACPTLLPLGYNTSSLAVCFPSEDAVGSYLGSCSESSFAVGSCLHTGGIATPAQQRLDELPTCTYHRFHAVDKDGGLSTAVLSSPGCEAITAPVVSQLDSPSLQAYTVLANPSSDQAQLSLKFTHPISSVSRPGWSVNNGKVLYMEPHNNSVILGVQFLDLQRPATLTIPPASLYSAISGKFSANSIVVEFSPDLPTAIAASVNSAAAMAALLGSATPLRIARSILHSQFLSWTGSLAVPALPPLYRQMVRTSPVPCTPCMPHHTQTLGIPS